MGRHSDDSWHQNPESMTPEPSVAHVPPSQHAIPPAPALQESAQVQGVTVSQEDNPRTASTATSNPKKAAKPKRATKKRKLTVGTVIWRLLMTLIVGALVLVIGVYLLMNIPDPSADPLPEPTKVYFADGTTEIGALTDPTRTVVTDQDISQAMKDAVVAAEDPLFYSQPAIGISDALSTAWESLWGGQAASEESLTEKYAELATKRASIPVIGTIQRLLMPAKIDAQLSKDEVLAGYLNTVYFGRGAYGVEEAAQRYFGVAAADLNASQSALLTALIPAPSAWDPAIDANQAQAQFNKVAKAIGRSDTSIAGEADTLTLPETSAYNAGASYTGTNGYILAMVRKELTATARIAVTEIDQGSLKVTTTINAHTQQKAVDAVATLPHDKPANLQAGLIALDPHSGAVMAVYGGEDYAARGTNNATEQRSPAGAPFKAVALIENFEKDLGSNNTYYHYPNGWVDGDYYPSEPVMPHAMTALPDFTKYNQDDLYVRIAGDVGTEVIRDKAVELGIAQDAPSLTAEKGNVLGDAQVTAQEMVRLYAAIANGGVQTLPYAVQEVMTSSGAPAYTASPHEVEVMQQDSATLSTHMLQLPLMDDGVAAAHAEPVTSIRQAAGLPSNKHSKQSSWFVGYTPQIVTAVTMIQIGDDGSLVDMQPFGGADNTWGNGYPEKVWAAFMAAASENLPVESFPDATELIKATTKVSPSFPEETPEGDPRS